MAAAVGRGAGQSAALQLVGADEIKADKKLSYLLDNAVEGRWLAFRATEPLPADTEVSVVVSSGTPSAEGPLVTPTDQSYTFHTYAALRIIDHGCSYGNNPCCSRGLRAQERPARR